MTDANHHRRRFLLGAASIAGTLLIASAANATALPVQQVQTDTLDISYHESGPAGGHPIILLHGAFDGIQRYAGIAPILAKQGYRVLVPYLRGHGSTRILDAVPDASASSADQQAALGQDLLDFMDALHIPEAVLAGYDVGGRAASAVAARKPTRVVGLVLADAMTMDSLATAVAQAACTGKWRT